MTDYDIDFLAAYSEEVAVAHEGFGRKDKADWHRAIAQILRDSKWVSVEDELPPEPEVDDPVEYDVWANGEREVNIFFQGGQFKVAVLDFEDDFDHWQVLKGVTHWRRKPKPPK